MADEKQWKWTDQKGCHGYRMPSLLNVLTFIFWAIVIWIVIQILISEMKHNACYLSDQCSCASPFYRLAPQPGDSNVTLLQKVENGIRQPEEANIWRKSLLISIALGFIGAFVYKGGWPSVIQFIIFVAIAFLIIYMFNSWYDMHIWYRVREQELRTVDQLRVNLGYLTPSDACGVYGPSNTEGFDYTACQGPSCSSDYVGNS